MQHLNNGPAIKEDAQQRVAEIIMNFISTGGGPLSNKFKIHSTSKADRAGGVEDEAAARTHKDNTN